MLEVKRLNEFFFCFCIFVNIKFAFEIRFSFKCCNLFDCFVFFCIFKISLMSFSFSYVK